jgi:glycosyltransferase involved in cell wall biosynthesis
LRVNGRTGKLRRVTARVLHIDTERGWRGGERQTLWLARELARRGHASIVAARTGEPLAARAAAEGVEVVACDPTSEIDPRPAFALRKLIRARGIQVVHAHTGHAVATAAMATAGTDVPFVVSRRVDFPLRANVGTKIKYGRAARFIAISRAVARVLERSGVAADRIVVVPDGVDVHRIVVAASRETLASLGVRGGPLVVQIAQLVGHKDPLNFVRAMGRAREQVPNIQGLLVGDGPLKDAARAEVVTLGLEDTVHVAGYRTDADQLLAAADVASLSSREEGMGSVLLDALAFGRPIAATSAGGIPEVVVDGECGLLAPVADPAALGAAIARLASDTVLATRIAEAAKSRARSFSVEIMTDRTVEVYDQVIAASR